MSTARAVIPQSVKALLITGAYYPPQVGGISGSMAKLVAALGPDHICCFTGVRADKPREKDPNGSMVYRFPSLTGNSKISKGVAWAAAMTTIMVRERPRVIVLGSADDSGFGLWLQRRLSLPFILFAYGNEILSAVRHKYEQQLRAFRLANRVVTCSRYTATLAQGAGADPGRIEVVYPGCDTEVFRPLPVRSDLSERILGGRDDRRQVILTVGNLVSRKGHDMVIRALPLLKERVPSFVYLIVGDGPYRNVLESLAREVGMGDRVVFTGKIPDEEIPYLHALSDVFVMPSREQLDDDDVEGLGMVFLEANACNKPVIGGRTGGVPEAVAEGVTGLLVDPHSPEEIAEALVRLLTNREFAQRLGEQGRSRVVREFQWTHFGERVLSLLSTVQAEGMRSGN